MRLNAPITALLALAVSLPGPASLTAATRTAHRVAAHTSPAPVASSKKRTRKKSADDAPAPHKSHRKRTRKRPADDAPDPITIERVRTVPGSAKPKPAMLRPVVPLRETAPSAGILT